MSDDKQHAFVGKKEYALHEKIANADSSQCIEWDGCVNQSGTPYMKFRGRRIVTVRRLVYGWLKHGFPSLPWTGGRLTTTCGNQLCINPNHIVEE
jgi:hypothetical protein